MDRERSASGIRIRPVDAPLGAVVECGDLKRIDDAGRRMLRQAWIDHIVLVFRGQDLSDDALLDVSSIFGPTAVAAILPNVKLYSKVAIVSNVVENGKRIGILGDGEVIWHTDHSFQERPLSAALLYAVEVPPEGGDTHFANMYAALQTLPADLARRIGAMTIKNDGSHNSAGERRTDEVVTDLRTYKGVSHPIVRTHPDSGCDVLYLGRRPNAYINGLGIEESEDVLDRLWAHATSPRFAWQHHWAVGDLVVWDNRCAMHRRDPFDPAARRVMHRAQSEGERPYRDPTASAPPHPRWMQQSRPA